MKRLCKPRRKRRSLIMTFRYTLDVHEDNPDEAKKIGKLFKDWMRDKFSTWDDTILQKFLYENNIYQNSKDDRLYLEGHLEKIVKDDFSSDAEEKEFDEKLYEDIEYFENEEHWRNIKDTLSSEAPIDPLIPTVGEPGFKEYKKRS